MGVVHLVYSYTDLADTGASSTANAQTAAKRLNNAVASGLVKAGDIVISVYDFQNIDKGGTHFKHAYIISDMLFGTEATIHGNAVAFKGGTATTPSLQPYRNCCSSSVTATKYSKAYVGYPTVLNYFNDSVEIGSALGAMFGAGTEKEGNGFFVFRLVTSKPYNMSIWKEGKDDEGNVSTKSKKDIQYTLYDDTNHAIAVFTMDDYGYAEKVDILDSNWTAKETYYDGNKQVFVTADLTKKPENYHFLETKTNANFAKNERPVEAIVNEGDVPTTAAKIAEFTTTGVDYETPPTEYYVAIRKMDQDNSLMNGVYFDISVNGTTYTQMMQYFYIFIMIT